MQHTIVCLRSGLYAQRRRKKSDPFIPYLENSNILTFVPRREITRISKTSSKVFQKNMRRFLLVFFAPLKNDFQRRKLSRCIQRTPLIRIRPGLFLLPQIRTKRVRQYSPALLRPAEFMSRLLELGTPVWYAPRLELVGTANETVIPQLVRSHLQKRAQGIVRRCRKVYFEIKNASSQANKIKRFKQPFLELRLQLRLLRKQSQFFQNEFGIDITDIVGRVASAVTRVRHQLDICDT
ncbi:MAG: hypothetical protein ACFFCF_04985 [Promethearchaeota archaeon]